MGSKKAKTKDVVTQEPEKTAGVSAGSAREEARSAAAARFGALSTDVTKSSLSRFAASAAKRRTLGGE